MNNTRRRRKKHNPLIPEPESCYTTASFQKPYAQKVFSMVQASAHRRFVFALCCGGMICVALASNFTPIFLTTFAEEFGGPHGLGEEELGRIAAALFAAFVAGILVSGPLADRLGGKTFALTGLFLVVVGLITLTATRNYGMLLVAAALLGLAAGVLDMILSPIVSALEPDRRASAMNWLHSFYCIGAVGTVLVGSGALYLNIPWRWVSALLIALPLSLFIGFLPFRVPQLVHEDSDRMPVMDLLRQPLFYAAVGLILLAGATEIGLAQWLPAYAERAHGYSKTVSAMALAGFSVAMVIGRMLVASLAHRIDPIVLMLTCAVMTLLAVLVGAFCPVGAVSIFACMAVGFTGGPIWPTTLAVTANRFPHGGATMFALISAAGNTGCFITPWVIGAVAEYAQLRWGLATVALCPFLMIAVLLLMRRHRRH